MITSIQITDTMAGTVISPAPNQFITALKMTKSQSPPWQQESYIHYPFNRWVNGRFVLKDATGTLFNFATQSGSALFASRVVLNGASLRFNGDLYLECLPKNQEWEMSISDVPATRSQAA